MSMGKFSVTAMKMGLLMAICLLAVKPAMSDVQSSKSVDVHISRPIDGSTVREVVNILVPARSVPNGGYVIYHIDGRFRCAQSIKSANHAYYLYSWDTKALNPDTRLSMDQRESRDGKHTIQVRVCDSKGKTVAGPTSISVYVKNHLSASDLPAQGIRLRYKHTVGAANKYKFKWIIDVASVGGNTDDALAFGEGVDGSEGLIQRSVENVFSDGNALVRDRLLDVIRNYRGGRLTPAAEMEAKPAFIREDALGTSKAVITLEPGSPVSLVLPKLPWQRIRIGDEWVTGQKVWWDAKSGKSVNMKTVNTFEGLEWQSGYPCAKIRSRFSGTITLPFSTVLNKPVAVSGETITYFCYRMGKVVSTVTTASAKSSMDAASVNALMQQSSQPQTAQSAGASGRPAMASAMAEGREGANRMGGRSRVMRGPMAAMGAGGGVPGIGGPAGMEGNGAYSPPGISTNRESQSSEVVFKVTESVMLLR